MTGGSERGDELKGRDLLQLESGSQNKSRGKSWLGFRLKLARD